MLSLILTSCWSIQRDILNDTNLNAKFIQKEIESPTFWNLNAKVQLIEFADFQCPACIRFNNAIWQKLMKEYVLTNKIWITFKNFPLNIHVNAPEDALAWLCAHEKWKYLDFAEKMYSKEEEKSWIEISREERIGIAKEIWLDTQDFAKCIDEWRYVNKIKSDMQEWDKMWLEWTPSIYANWKLINYNSEESFFQIIDQLIKQ